MSLTRPQKMTMAALSVPTAAAVAVGVFAAVDHEPQRPVVASAAHENQPGFTVPDRGGKDAIAAEFPAVIEAAPAEDSIEDAPSSGTGEAASSAGEGTGGSASTDEAASARSGGAEAASSKKARTSGPSCDVPGGATADKVLVVDGTGGASASVKACEKSGSGYVEAFSTSGHVGYNGIAAPGAKREGDGKTPAGVFGLGDGFGVQSKPSEFSGSWTTVTGDHVWVDGSATKNYNTMQRRSDGYSGESLRQSPAYDFAQVINYNTAGTPGKGSAIFLHVNTGSGKTAGCVSVSKSALTDIFAWEDASTQIAIVQ